mgnify:CR=1 FL=1
MWAGRLWGTRLARAQGVEGGTWRGKNVTAEAGGAGRATTRDVLSSVRGESKDPIAELANASTERLASAGGSAFVGYADGFASRYDPERKRAGTIQFPEFLDKVSRVDP